MMQMTPVASSNISQVGYDEDTQTLQVEFTKGGRYEYYDVPQGVYEGLVNAGSAGSYFHDIIKGAYRYSRM